MNTTNTKKPLLPSLDKQAGLIMQRIWFNKELKVNLAPKEYDSVNKLVIFHATPLDTSKEAKPFKYTSHVRDLQHRIDTNVLVSQAMCM